MNAVGRGHGGERVPGPDGPHLQPVICPATYGFDQFVLVSRVHDALRRR